VKRRKPIAHTRPPEAARLYAAWRAAERDADVLRNVDLVEAELRASRAWRAYLYVLGLASGGPNRPAEPAALSDREVPEDLTWMHQSD
jgi:hypothetical protein